MANPRVLTVQKISRELRGGIKPAVYQPDEKLAYGFIRYVGMLPRRASQIWASSGLPEACPDGL